MAYPEPTNPLLAVVRLLLAERQLDQLSVAVSRCGEGDHMPLHVTEIVASILILARTQTLCEREKLMQIRVKYV